MLVWLGILRLFCAYTAVTISVKKCFRQICRQLGVCVRIRESARASTGLAKVFACFSLNNFSRQIRRFLLLEGGKENKYLVEKASRDRNETKMDFLRDREGD